MHLCLKPPDKLKMNPVTLKENINRLDIEKNHLCYIHVIYNQDINGNYKVRTFGTVEWLTSNGKDYLDDLNHSWERTFWLISKSMAGRSQSL